ncbi:MAG: 16S rRNA (cytidine(1402)-2'-O)-methyltransferase [Bacteroidota bacterium]
MSKLFLVPTPIGNLGDITFRAVEVLKTVDFILAEDTRTSGILLKHFEISKPLVAHHQHNEHSVLERIVQRIGAGETAALISDAGTPAISDPGFLLLRECLRNGIEVECLPGPTAFLPALINSGLPADRFLFEGFLPHKKGRKSKLEYLSEVPYTVVLYESPHRLLKTLEQLAEHCGAGRQASVSRELTKMYEETRRGTLADLIAHFKEETVKGEFVIVMAGK